MKRCTRTIKLYNVLFPLWMLLMFPQAWLIVLPGNLVIDSLVLVVAMLALKLSEKRTYRAQSPHRTTRMAYLERSIPLFVPVC